MAYNQKEYMKEWYSKNKEHVLNYKKQYRQDHAQQLLEYNKQYKELHKEENKIRDINRKESYRGRRRELQLKRYYQLTYKEWLQIWNNQDGKCLICQIPFDKPSDSCVDHNHITGEIRGLLCRKCNCAIGLLKENIQSIKNMLKYLEG
jgi:hypothetical protein